MARTMVTCTRCGRSGHISIMHRVEKNNRGQRGAYICERCNNEIHNYSTKNNEQRGADTVHPFTYGMENETTYSNAKARSELYEYGMLPTADCTVDVEYKSAIENSLKSFSHLWKVMDKLIANGDMEIGSTAGSHFHVGHRDLNGDTMEYIRRFYHSLFLPLSEAMKANDEATRKIFGRGIDEYNDEDDCWARSINENTDPLNHTNFINTQHSMTLEFRMAKFQNSKQYMKMAKFATRVTEIVMDTFVAHFNDDFTLDDVRKLERNWKLNFGVNSSEYIDIQQVNQTGCLDSIPFNMCKRQIAKYFRLYNAKMAAQKIVKAFMKAIEG